MGSLILCRRFFEACRHKITQTNNFGCMITSSAYGYLPRSSFIHDHRQYFSMVNGPAMHKKAFLIKNLSIPMVSRSTAANSSNGKTENDIDQKKTSLVKRFKDAYAIYGKVVLITHGVTSCLWFGGFYALASSGINLLDILDSFNAPEWLRKPLHLGGGAMNTLATALVFYKLAAPLRYGLTLILTRYLVRYLRLTGKAPQVQESDRLRNLAKEGAQISRERIKARMAKSRRYLLARKNKR
ncbi:unnamed protein product [Trichobilharzia szidati]|nr:unnamed protein product [Trichobilharzia szidati]